MDAIPRETALQLCAEIRQENRGKWYRFARNAGAARPMLKGTLTRCV